MVKKVKIPTDEEILFEYKKNFQLMWSARSEWESDWTISDQQIEAVTIVDNNGNVKVNVPLEKSLVEFVIGRNAGPIKYEVVPKAQPSVDQLQPAKYALAHFMDDDESIYPFYNEKRKWEYDSATYGTGVLFTGLTHSVDKVYELDADADDFYSNSYKEKELTRRCFTPRNIPLRNFWVDHMAIFQPDFRQARFCVIQEEASPEELKLRWKGLPGFKNIDDITPMQNLRLPYLKTPIMAENAIIHYRFNRITKDYWIIVNAKIVVYAGKMLYRHNKMPVIMRQYYPTRFIYGEGIPKRVRTIKAYKNTTLQSMLDKMQFSSGVNIGIGNNGQTDGQLYTAPGEVNIWSFTSSMDNVKQFNLDGNIQSQSMLLNILDDIIIQDSGENIKAPYSSPAGTATEAEILEENKAVRQKGVDELRDIALDEALTMALYNIAQFAPVLLRQETEKIIDGETVKVKIEYPKIKVPNMKIEKRDGKITFTEDYGEYGFFEFKPETITGDLTVKIQTASTSTGLKAVEKNSITQYIQNMLTLAQINPAIVQKIDLDGIIKRSQLAYGIDNQLTTSTKRDEIRAKNEKMIKAIQESLALTPPINDQQTTETNPQQPGVPGMPEASATQGANQPGAI